MCTVRSLSVSIMLTLLALLVAPMPCRAGDTLMVGTWKTPQTMQPFLYKDFLPGNKPIEVRAFTNPGDQKNALLAGSLDFTGTTLVQAILSASRGEPVVLVASLCMKCSALVVGKNTGITKTSDLRGHRIGYVPGTMHHILLLDTLSKVGLKPQDVQLVRVDFFDMQTALSRGQIDAFLSGEPYPTRARIEGVGTILAYPYFGDTIGPINAGMLVTRDMIKQDPGRIQMLVNAHAQATEYLKHRPEVWLKQSQDFGFKESVVRAAAPNIELTWDMDADFLRHTRNLALRMRELGIIANVPDIGALVDTRFVDAARRSREKHAGAK